MCVCVCVLVCVCVCVCVGVCYKVAGGNEPLGFNKVVVIVIAYVDNERSHVNGSCDALSSK